MANNLLEWCVEHFAKWPFEDDDVIEQGATGCIHVYGHNHCLKMTDVFEDWETDYVTKQDWEKAKKQ